MPISAASSTGAAPVAWISQPTGLGPSSLRKVYLDLLGRPPLEHERATWLGKPRAALVDALLPSEEHWRNWLDAQLYYFLLVDNFRPATEGVSALPRELAEGRIGVREALHRVCLTTSFDRRNPGPDTFVSVVMEQILGLTVQKATRELEIGKRVYDGAQGNFLGRVGGSQADIVHIAMSDPRALTYLLEREHLRLLHQAPSAELSRRWVACLDADELAFGLILKEWMLSDAYDKRLQQRFPLPNRVFVRALHVDLLGRVPDEVEAQRFRSALDGLADSVPLRSLIARLMLDSGKAIVSDRGAIRDPVSWIEDQFERLLGRTPTEAEHSVFAEALRDPACRPATLLYAIVSHPEYQAW